MGIYPKMGNHWRMGKPSLIWAMKDKTRSNRGLLCKSSLKWHWQQRVMRFRGSLLDLSPSIWWTARRLPLWSLEPHITQTRPSLTLMRSFSLWLKYRKCFCFDVPPFHLWWLAPLMTESLHSSEQNLICEEFNSPPQASHNRRIVWTIAMRSHHKVPPRGL